MSMIPFMNSTKNWLRVSGQLYIYHTCITPGPLNMHVDVIFLRSPKVLNFCTPKSADFCVRHTHFDPFVLNCCVRHWASKSATFGMRPQPDQLRVLKWYWTCSPVWWQLALSWGSVEASPQKFWEKLPNLGKKVLKPAWDFRFQGQKRKDWLWFCMIPQSPKMAKKCQMCVGPQWFLAKSARNLCWTYCLFWARDAGHAWDLMIFFAKKMMNLYLTFTWIFRGPCVTCQCFHFSQGFVLKLEAPFWKSGYFLIGPRPFFGQN